MTDFKRVTGFLILLSSESKQTLSLWFLGHPLGPVNDHEFTELMGTNSIWFLTFYGPSSYKTRLYKQLKAAGDSWFDCLCSWTKILTNSTLCSFPKFSCGLGISYQAWSIKENAQLNTEYCNKGKFSRSEILIGISSQFMFLCKGFHWKLLPVNQFRALGAMIEQFVSGINQWNFRKENKHYIIKKNLRPRT